MTDRQPLEELIQYLGYERETPLASELLSERDEHGEVIGAGW